jgi:hypothetical protein
MHLVSCNTPSGSLEAAPRSALVAEPSGSESDRADRWDGFWSSQTDGYYARCTHGDGEVEWFQVADDPASAASEASNVAPRQRTAAHAGARVAVIVARSPDGRGMLVGSGRRGSRA